MTPFKRPTKAVITAAGFGTRFLPQTKALPKEMFPLVDKPIIQYIVEDLVRSGIQDIILVTGYHKRAIEDHFDVPNQDLIANLQMGGEKKKPLIDEVKEIANMANFVYVRQKGPYGNGTPLLSVSHLIGNEPFIYTWADDMIVGTPTEHQQLMDVYEKFGVSCLSGTYAKHEADYNNFGFVGGKILENEIIDIKEIIEKPGKEKAPSDLATVSSFLFTPDIFDYIDVAIKNRLEGNELYYVDILKEMLSDGKRVLAVPISGEHIDLGNKLDYLKAVVRFAKKDLGIGKEFTEWLQDEGCKF